MKVLHFLFKVLIISIDSFYICSSKFLVYKLEVFIFVVQSFYISIESCYIRCKKFIVYRLKVSNISI